MISHQEKPPPSESPAVGTVPSSLAAASVVAPAPALVGGADADGLASRLHLDLDVGEWLAGRRLVESGSSQPSFSAREGEDAWRDRLVAAWT